MADFFQEGEKELSVFDSLGLPFVQTLFKNKQTQTL